MSDPLEIVSINLGRRIAISANDEIWQITHMFDSDGDETNDPAEAVQAVATRPGKPGWTAINIRKFSFQHLRH